ncbi:hypothetical protein [Piscirickettsia litoralis]|uniref:Uncharacterized protein n=1 Tax=Piscirickettsia litoralis TaxID=1891921 RepID=A0ABX2ZY37_9GAMM|nr:hypothetical protein [Piscirickettsia litoralis]ODN41115.1 hypothetical protein BGC07_17730 [Piscirickettsia litoralis]
MKTALKTWFKVGENFNFNSYHNYVIAGAVPGLLVGALLSIGLFEGEINLGQVLGPVSGWISAVATISIPLILFISNRGKDNREQRKKEINELTDILSKYFDPLKREAIYTNSIYDLNEVLRNMGADPLLLRYKHLKVGNLVNDLLLEITEKGKRCSRNLQEVGAFSKKVGKKYINDPDIFKKTCALQIRLEKMVELHSSMSDKFFNINDALLDLEHRKLFKEIVSDFFLQDNNYTQDDLYKVIKVCETIQELHLGFDWEVRLNDFIVNLYKEI